MNIDQWQTRHEISDAELARRLNVHSSLISHIKKGRRNWTPKMAEAMEVLSGGEVPRLRLLYPDSTQKSKIHTTFFHKMKTLFSRRSDGQI